MKFVVAGNVEIRDSGIGNVRVIVPLDVLPHPEANICELYYQFI